MPPTPSNPGQNAGTPGGPTQPNPPGNIQGAAQRNLGAGNQLQPGQTVQVESNTDVLDLQFNGNTIVKLRVPKGFDVRGAYSQFEKDHAHVSDKKGAFPTSFAGDLVNKHGAEQLPPDAVVTRTEAFRIT